MAEILPGKQLAKAIREKAAQRIAKVDATLGLAAILVGDDKASHLYVSLKEKAAKEVGIYFEKVIYPADVTTKELLTKVKELNTRNDIHGILVQLPLPKQNEDRVIAAIDPDKDVDGFHPVNRDRRANGEPSLVPPVALSIMRLIQASHQPLGGKTATIVANNEIFAEPLLMLFEENGVAAQFVQPDAGGIDAKLRAADIIVVAVGRAGFVTKEMVKDGAIVIDVGTNKIKGKLYGDAAAAVAEHAAFLSPVPGGVGPLTVAYLLMNVLKAALQQKTQK